MSREPAHVEVRAAIQGLGPVTSSRLTYVEVGSALGVARRSLRISPSDLVRAQSQFARLWRLVEVIELDGWVADAAVHVGEAFGLRSHDSIQLASALQDAEVTMIALDNRLRRAATDAGLAVAP